MKILKFGGSSTSNAQDILRCVDIIQGRAKQDQVIVVVSAMADTTDLLLKAAELASEKNEHYIDIFHQIEMHHINIIKELIAVDRQAGVLSRIIRKLNQLEILLNGCLLLGELSPKSKDLILSYGERIASLILSDVLTSGGVDCLWINSQEIIRTDDHYGKANVNFPLTNGLIQEFFSTAKFRVAVVPGFVAETDQKQITTLGRGGSDYTASILAAALNIEAIEMWTDVSGIYTADPKLVRQARTVKNLSFQEAMELSHFGTKVLYAPALLPILSKEISLHIRNTFDPEAPGTVVCNAIPNINGSTIRGISNIDNVALFTVEGPGMVGATHLSKRLFEVFSAIGVNIIFITQASSEYSFCFAVEQEDAHRLELSLNDEFRFEIEEHKIKPIQVERDLSVIAVVGENMRNHQGESGKMFSALGRNNVNIRAIAQGASERNISAIIRQKDVRKALNTLHEVFFEEDVVQLNLFVMGIGNVGRTFLKLIEKQHDYLAQYLKLNVRVIGLANSTKMCFDREGLKLNDLDNLLSEGIPMSQSSFVDKIKELNLRNSVFVDMTASEEVARSYATYLYNSIAVVTCNKIACASDYDYYKRLKSISRKYHAPFLFETSVGAGLPIIDTLKNLIASGDRIHRIEAVLSGSLNFIFNHFDEQTPFDRVVSMAQDEGFTEPDPMIDLSGVDVRRKLMILVRESGYKIEIDEILSDSFLPQSCFKTKNTDELFEQLKANKEHFDRLYDEAKKEGARLKFVASYNNGVGSVGLQKISSNHDFYNLEGKDNIVLFYTDRYAEQPLVVKGAGAGASVTASGIFADVIRIGNKTN